MHSVDSVMH